MSYIRKNESRKYFDGESNVYLYPSGSPQAVDHPVRGEMSQMTETDLAEVALRVIERTDLSDDQFSDIVDEVTETYPREIDWPDTIEEDND